MTTGSFRSANLVTQARPFLPLMFMASDPHTPSRQERRSARESSMDLMRIRASSNMRSLSCQLDLVVLHVGRAVLVRVVAVDLEMHAGDSWGYA